MYCVFFFFFFREDLSVRVSPIRMGRFYTRLFDCLLIRSGYPDSFYSEYRVKMCVIVIYFLIFDILNFLSPLFADIFCAALTRRYRDGKFRKVSTRKLKEDRSQSPSCFDTCLRNRLFDLYFYNFSRHYYIYT